MRTGTDLVASKALRAVGCSPLLDCTMLSLTPVAFVARCKMVQSKRTAPYGATRAPPINGYQTAFAEPSLVAGLSQNIAALCSVTGEAKRWQGPQSLFSIAVLKSLSFEGQKSSEVGMPLWSKSSLAVRAKERRAQVGPVPVNRDTNPRTAAAAIR
jgi:hypothetical protein